MYPNFVSSISWFAVPNAFEMSKKTSQVYTLLSIAFLRVSVSSAMAWAVEWPLRKGHACSSWEETLRTTATLPLRNPNWYWNKMFLFFIHSFHILSEKTPLYMSNTVALIRIVNSICRFVRSVRIDNLLYAPCAACISLSHQECISLLRQRTCTVCRFVRSVRIELVRSVHLIITSGVHLIITSVHIHSVSIRTLHTDRTNRQFCLRSVCWVHTERASHYMYTRSVSQKAGRKTVYIIPRSLV